MAVVCNLDCWLGQPQAALQTQGILWTLSAASMLPRTTRSLACSCTWYLRLWDKAVNLNPEENFWLIIRVLGVLWHSSVQKCEQLLVGGEDNYPEFAWRDTARLIRPRLSRATVEQFGDENAKTINPRCTKKGYLLKSERMLWAKFRFYLER